jgi:hypothetical protein
MGHNASTVDTAFEPQCDQPKKRPASLSPAGSHDPPVTNVTGTRAYGRPGSAGLPGHDTTTFVP